NSALGWAAMLREGRLDATASKRGIETVERNIRLLARLIDDLIDLSRIAAGKLTVERKPVYLDTVISAAAEAVRPAATSGGVVLTIGRHLGGLHGGTVTAASAGEGRGSTFTIELPLLADGARPAPVEAPRDESSLPALDDLNVLLVDDDPDGREVLAVILEKCGARPVTTASTIEALAALDHARFDAMVADIGMPGRDGYDLIRTVRARTDDARDIPAIAFTAFA